jgi:hypothetical protein
MKNHHVERLKYRAKQYHRNKREDHFNNGMLVFHDYTGLPSDRLTWGDDVTFIINDYRVALAWTHPRMAYEEAIDAETDRLAANSPKEDFLRDGKPIYRILGKSRKKITHTVYELRPQSCWRDEWDRTRYQVMQSANIEIAPSMNVRWCQYSRLVSLCVPVEVRKIADLDKLMAMTKRLLSREVVLEELFPGYCYTRADWEREGLHDTHADLHAHSISS